MRLVLEQVVKASRSAEMQNRAMKEKLQISIRELNSINDRIDEFKNEALIDSLTGLFNRKYYNQTIVKEINYSFNLGRPLTLLIIDIDKFKRFNDTYGHLTGDQILRLLGVVLKQNVRMQDIACRLGGEEFVLLLPDTPLRAALVVADNIRRLVMAKELVRKSTNEIIGRVTCRSGLHLSARTTPPRAFSREPISVSMRPKGAAGTRSWQKTILSFRRLLRSDKRKLGVRFLLGQVPSQHFKAQNRRYFSSVASELKPYISIVYRIFSVIGRQSACPKSRIVTFSIQTEKTTYSR